MRTDSTPINAEHVAFDALYDDLRAVAATMLRRERDGHTLQATAVVHEAFMRLSASGAAQRFPESELLAIASRVIRQVLIDYARTRGREKRSGNSLWVGRPSVHLPQLSTSSDIEELDRALTELRKNSPRAAQIVDLRFFGGLPMTRVAEIVGCSRSTAQADWLFARASILNSMSLHEPS